LINGYDIKTIKMLSLRNVEIDNLLEKWSRMS